MAEPDRDLAEYPGAQADQARLLHLGGGSESQSVGVYRLLQSDDRQAVQVDVPGEGSGDLNHWLI